MIQRNTWTGITADKDLLRRCKEAVTIAVPEADVILYGSRARGDASHESDYDILVLVNQPVSIRLEERILEEVFPLELETGALLTLAVYSKDQWNSPLYKAMPFHKNVDREGVLL